MMVLVTGGSGSGKSAYAENRIMSFDNKNKFYIATMVCFDQESEKRVIRHREMRAGKGFETIEKYVKVKELLFPENTSVLLECMSNLVANEMFQTDGAKEHTVSEIVDGIDEIHKNVDNLVIVTNEIFSDGTEYDSETNRYQKYLGEINQRLAEKADEVVEVVYGIPVIHKGV